MEAVSGSVPVDYEYHEESAYDVVREKNEPSFEESRQIPGKNLAERVQVIDRGNRAYHTIDRLVTVITHTQGFIQERINYWEGKSAEAWKLGICGFGFALVGQLLRLINKKNGPAGMLVTVPAFIYGLYQFAQSTAASSQIANWKKDPVKEIADQRAKGLQEGLFSIYRWDQLGVSRPKKYQEILGKNELQGLYGEYFYQFKDQFERAVDDQTRLSLLEKATWQSPLALEICRYAQLSQTQIDQMEGMRERHNNFIRTYKGIGQRIETERGRIKENSEKLISMIQEENKRALKPLEEAFAKHKSALIDERTNKLEGPPPTGVEIPDFHKNVKEEFELKLKEAKSRFEGYKKEISAPYNERIEKIQKDENEMLDSLKGDRSKQLLLLFSYVMCLHKEAYKLYQGEAYTLAHLQKDPGAILDVYSQRYTASGAPPHLL